MKQPKFESLTNLHGRPLGLRAALGMIFPRGVRLFKG
jgi:hypothetical protein